MKEATGNLLFIINKVFDVIVFLATGYLVPG